MTGRTVYNRALTLLHERGGEGEIQYDTAQFEAAAPTLINVLAVMLDELDLHIKHRAFHEAEYLPKQIVSLDEELSLHPSICMSVLPLGLAFFLVSEENESRAALFFKLYQTEKDALYRRYRTVRRHKIKSVY